MHTHSDSEQTPHFNNPDVSHKNGHTPKKYSKFILPILTIFLLLIGLITTQTLVQQPQDIRQNATEINNQSTIPLSQTPFKFASNTVNLISGGYMGGLPKGIYDAAANKTFIVYPSGVKGSKSASSPYIIAYDHQTGTFSQEKEIAINPVGPDGHDYPTVVLDNNGYIHVFQTFHGVDSPWEKEILHAVSQNPHDSTSWNTSYIRGTNNNTYGFSYKAINGDIYVFYRDTKRMYNPWHETLSVIKSPVSGQTQPMFNNWQFFDLIDPGANSDKWNTVYVKAVNYVTNPEGVQILFGIHKNHNDSWNKHYYVFYSFVNNHLYSASGQDLGTKINRNTYESCCLVFDYGKEMTDGTDGNVYAALEKDVNGRPLLFFNKLNPIAPNKAHGQFRFLRWNGSSWLAQDYPEFGEIVGAYEVEYKSDQNIDVYVYKWEGTNARYYKYKFNGANWSQLPDIFDVSTSSLNFIQNYSPDLKGVYLKGSYSNWNNPLPTGEYFAFRDIVSASPSPTPLPTPSPTPVAVCGVPQIALSQRCSGAGRVDITATITSVSGVVNYRTQISQSNSFSPLISNQLSTNTSVTFPSLSAQTTYYVRSRAEQSNGSCIVPSQWRSTSISIGYCAVCGSCEGVKCAQYAQCECGRCVSVPQR